MKEAVLFEHTGDGKVRCTACARYCKLGEGQTGLCGVRQNIGGRLQLLVYGRVITGHIDPIEKKPLVHYMPGTRIFSIATTGCNWLCRYCQNYDISQRRKVEGELLAPEEIVSLAQKNRCEGIAYTYNEPTIYLEFAHDVGVIARKKGIFNSFVSNGYGTPEDIPVLNDFLDAITVDFKGNAEKGFVRKTGRVLLRSAAQPGQLLCVTGELGGAAADFLKWKKGKRPGSKSKLTSPVPRITEGMSLSSRGVAYAAIDITDGLALSAWYISRASGVGIEMEGKALPVSPALAETADGERQLQEALFYWGGDYELLFTAKSAASVVKLSRELNTPLSIIGKVTKGSGVRLKTAAGVTRLEERGYDAFAKSSIESAFD